MTAASLRPSQIFGEATRLLLAGGFRDVGALHVQPSQGLRMFEDRLCIVGLVYYPAWADLENSWLDAQAVMVEKISQHFRRSDPKAWDGYLVLFTMDESPRIDAVSRIENDTSRLRKLVATGRELKAISSVEEALLPVLPFNVSAGGSEDGSLLERIPQMLADRGIEHSLATAAIESFQANRSPLEGIESWQRD